MKNKKSPRIVQVELSPKTIFLVLGIVTLISFVYLIKNVIIMTFVAFILSSTLMPMIKKLERWKFPRFLAIIIVYLSVIIFLTVLTSAVSIPLVKQIIAFTEKLPETMENFADSVNSFGTKLGIAKDLVDEEILTQNIEKWGDEISNDLGSFLSAGAKGARGVFDFVASLFGGILNILTVITISAYISLDHDNFIKIIINQFRDKKTQKRVKKLIVDIEDNLGSWLRGQITLSLIAGLLVWIMLTILGSPYALPLAMLAALLDSIPNFGATLAAVPAIAVAFLSGNPIQIFGVPLGYILIQQFENQILGPRIMANAVGLPPIVVILSLLVGAQLYGLTGILLAVPIAGMVHLGIQYWRNNHSKKAKAA